GDFVLMMADHAVGDEIMDLARDHVPPADGATLMVDYKLDTIFDMADATKVFSNDSLVKAIGKELVGYNCIDTGVFVCTLGLVDALRDLYAERGDVSLTDGIQYLARRQRMCCVDIG